MRVLDFHTHPYRPADLAPGTRAFVQRISAALREHGEQLANPRYFADALRAQGVERAVVLPEHCPATSGNVRTDSVLEWCAAAADVLIPFASVDPNTDGNAADLLQRYIDQGVRGLKLYPSYQFFYPNERRVYPIYEVCQSAGIPVLLHIGSSVIPGTRLKYCDPIYLDDVAADFPSLPIVMAHGGRGYWYDACAFLAAHFDNVYIDVTGLVPERLLTHFPQLEKYAQKYVFGTDWPAMPKSAAHNIEAIAALGLSDDALRRIYYENAAQLLHV
jgi:predicted TIM-barrel fold metal-dependent hydrolase